MLPQMMPLPWLMVFFMIFLCLYSVFLYISSFSFETPSSVKAVKVSTLVLPW